ncbi:MAG: hypothetical protein AB7P01_17295 [Bacteroidia bacterium]
MIYAYKPLTHKIEKFHENFAYFFEKMIEKDLAAYDEKKLLRKPFAKIINASGKLVGDMKKIVEQYHLLSKADKKVIKDALGNNCEIESLCDNSGGFTPVKYEQITDETFRKLLKDFLTELWEGYYFVNSIRDNFGTVQEHFLKFKEHQGTHVCPFCGLLPLKPAKGVYRNAYDHYIPKAFYPFVSVNYQNLFPICTDCNSDEKKATDTLYRVAARRQVFFPLDKKYKGEQLSVEITTNENYDKKTLKTLLGEIDWDLAIQLAGASDPRLVSWDEIFHIKRRYKEHLIDFQRTWFEDFVVRRYKEDMEDGLTFKRYKEKLLKDSMSQIKNNPLSILRFVYFNFLFSISDFETKLKETIK